MSDHARNLVTWLVVGILGLGVIIVTSASIHNTVGYNKPVTRP